MFEAGGGRGYDGAIVSPDLVSVVLCTRNRPQFIGPCVKSVLGQSHSDLEVLVIDQSATDDTGRILRNLDHPRRSILAYHRTSSRGLSRSRNLGVKLSRGRIVAFTDDDVVADGQWIRNLVAEYDRHPGVSVIFGRVLAYPEEGKGGVVGLMESAEERLFKPDHRVPYGIGGGNNMTFLRSVVERIGFFDEQLGAGARFRGAEDVDFIFRAFAAGMEVLYSPRPVVFHRHRWGDLRELAQLARDYNFANGAFVAKHLGAGTPGIVKVLAHRLWHYSLSAVAGGLRRGEPARIRRGLEALRDHASGAFAWFQRWAE